MAREEGTFNDPVQAAGPVRAPWQALGPAWREALRWTTPDLEGRTVVFLGKPGGPLPPGWVLGACAAVRGSTLPGRAEASARDAVNAHPDLAAARAAALDAKSRTARAVRLQAVVLAVAQAAWDADAEAGRGDLRGDDEWPAPGNGPGETMVGWQPPGGLVLPAGNHQGQALQWRGQLSGVNRLPRCLSFSTQGRPLRWPLT